MQAGFVRRRRARSGCRSSTGLRRPRTSRYGCWNLSALALDVALDLRTSHTSGSHHADCIDGDFMGLDVDGAAAATARFSQDAADSNRAWIVSTCPARLLGRDQAITALTVAQLLEGGYLDEHPLVAALRKELRCPTALIRVTTAHRRACYRSFADQVVLERPPRPCGGAHPGARGPARPRYVSAFTWCDNGVVRCPVGRLSAPSP